LETAAIVDRHSFLPLSSSSSSSTFGNKEEGRPTIKVVKDYEKSILSSNRIIIILPISARTSKCHSSIYNN
jgi:hypothetical protein